MRRIGVAGVASTAFALLAIVVISGCGSATGGSLDTDAATLPAKGPSPVTVTHTVRPRPHRRDKTAKRVPTHKAAKHRHGAANGNWVMPNEVGNGLQNAQDDVQRASGDPIFVSHSHDLRGDRFQILDRDWKVCTQNVSPGTKVGPAAHIDFGVVKLGESCP